jgi:ATP-dependent DNA helicase RecQ
LTPATPAPQRIRSDTPPDPGTVRAALSATFGFDAFRPGQEAVVTDVLAGRDVLVVMPTGGGKSLCYQLPACLLEGVTLVVSPLIALMKDQVDALRRRGIGAAAVNSSLSFDQVREVMADVRAGRVSLLYVAPERFASGFFMREIAEVPVARVAVDEAHCVSQWGHDFRPAYLRLKGVIGRLGRPPVSALTATATPEVQDDIARLLGLDDPARFVTGFDRHNLFLEVRAGGRKRDVLADFVTRNEGPGIVYCATRKRVDEASVQLAEMGLDVATYHAGLPDEARHAAQEAFLDGPADVIVATNAFGMGVDKPNVRYVLHYDMPGTLEAYYQEAGRAGRDGLPARCTLLYGGGDRFTQEFFITAQYPTEGFIRALWDELQAAARDDVVEVSHKELLERMGQQGSEMAVSAALKLLEGAGWLVRMMPRANAATIRVKERGRVGARAAVQRKILSALDLLFPEGERGAIQVPLAQLGADAGLDHDALLRGLHALEDAGAIDYIPPFRGRGLRLLRDDPPDLDYGGVEAQRRHALAALDRMEAYCLGHTCRRAAILAHFGEAAGEVPCGACDRCRSGAARQAPVEATELARKLLSGVARCRSGRSGFGVQTIAAHLVGGSTEAVRRHHLDALSTYGLLKAHTQRDVADLLEQLAVQGFVRRENVGDGPNLRPVLVPTETGLRVLRGEAEGVRLRLPEPSASTRTAPAARGSAPSGTVSGPEPDAGLLAALKGLRRELSRADEVPAYRVFTDRALAEMAALRPTTEAALAEVHGVGPAKLARYGEAFLEAIRADAGTREGP